VHRRTASGQKDAGYGTSPLVSCDPRSVSHHHDIPLSTNLYSSAPHSDAAAANQNARAGAAAPKIAVEPQRLKALYTPEERLRRDATKWTLVQGILAPVQFLVFLISLGLVIRYLLTGDGFEVATASIVIKTLVLYTIMITGAIWEKEVFGCYLFARAFFWEDVFSFLVLALHTAYLVMLFAGLGDPRQQMLVALAAYASYVVNATQFVLKLRAARRDERMAALTAANVSGSRA